MAKSKQTFQKNEREKKKKQKQKLREEEKALRKANSNKGKGLESMMAYVDHNGQLTNEPPDPKQKVEIKVEDILLGARSVVEEPEPKEKTGKIINYYSDRRFGFIKDQQSQQNVFFHYSDTNFDVQQDDTVTYELSHNEKGPCAINVRKANAGEGQISG